MKKILFVTLLILPFYAHATDMCARDDVMFFVLDGDVGGTSSEQTDQWEWTAVFSYGTITGSGACVSEYEYNNNKIRQALNGIDENGNERTICTCRTEHPFLSPWIKYGTYVSAEKCIEQCHTIYKNCGNYFYNPTRKDFRKNIINSIGT